MDRRIEIGRVSSLVLALFATTCAQPVDIAVTIVPPDAPIDGGAPDDASPADVDAGEDVSVPKACLRDQGGPALRGCDPGQVCHLTSGECRPGRPCENDEDCDACTSFTDSSVDCGHGLRLTAWCDKGHGGVCVRSRAPCEPCSGDCGRLDPSIGAGPISCLTYDDGQRFCGRPCAVGCPDGFECVDDQCFRVQGCVRNSVICPTAPDEEACPGTDQVCVGSMCPEPDAVCVTNDLPGVLGLCLGTCRANDDCPATKPLCNPRNGICTLACEQSTCSPDQTCHSDGLCWPGCTDDDECLGRNPDTYCNLPGRSWPKPFKTYRDMNSCAPLGCEVPEDCVEVGTTCVDSEPVPDCQIGCYSAADCAVGEACKSAQPGSYPPGECGALPDHRGRQELGVCCREGCGNRVFDCDLNQFCCGESGSPYEDPADCPPPIEAGQCFDPPVDPFCQTCSPGRGGECSAAWPYGQNSEPSIDNGRPFDEQSFCFRVSVARGVCSVGYRPSAPDPGAPRGWTCEPFAIPCLDTSDCEGLTCVGADLGRGVFGACRCGERGIAALPCPVGGRQIGAPVVRPRCRNLSRIPTGGNSDDLFCVAAYACRPPLAQPGLYPAACGL